jgi:polyisoprenoid-binding protein YceI
MEPAEITTRTKWSIDPVHSEIEFKVRHLMIAYVKGVFTSFNANIFTTGNDFTTADINVWIDASSINTGDDKRDEHLRSADFFDVKNHKQIGFASKTIGNGGKNGDRELYGELTMKGVTHNIRLDVQFGGIIRDPWGNEKAGFTLTGKINRNDWGLIWNTAIEAGGLMVSEEVIINCEVELTNVGPEELPLEAELSLNHKSIQ